jgi:hypothetical protein
MWMTKLIHKHHDVLTKVRDHWADIAVRTAPADRSDAEGAIQAAYRQAGLQLPESVSWVESPAALGAVLSRFSGSNCTGPDWAPLVPGIDKLTGAIHRRARQAVISSIEFRVEKPIIRQVWKDQAEAIWSAVPSNAQPMRRSYVGRYRYLVDDHARALARCALYDAYIRFGVLDPESWSGQRALAEHAGWWWASREVAVLCERPATIQVDDLGRLHCETGPAIIYRDGFTVHAWQGRYVPSWVMSGEVDVSRILQEENTEYRRIAIERYGWEKFIADSGMTLAAEAGDPGNAPFTLSLWDLPPDLAGLYRSDTRILLCTNGSVERDGTRRRFGLPVRGHHTDPVAAAAETYDIPLEAYRRLSARR